MADPNVPTRNQIARIVDNDPEMVKALERLFIVAGSVTPDEIAALTALIEANTASIETNTASIETNTALIDANTTLIEANTILIEDAAFDAGAAQNKAESYQQNFQKLDYIDFNRVGPHVALGRRMQWNEDDGTIDVGMNDDVMLQVGQETQYYAKNTSGGDILNGTPVMFTGTLGASGKLTFAEAVADGSSPALYMMGVATEDIANNGFGYVTSFGKVRGLDTSGTPYGETWNDGDIIYFSPSAAGTWTNVRPAAPNLDLPVAVVLNAATGGSGEIFVRMKTGETIDELHDVQAPSPSDGDILTYSTANSRWENTAPSAANDATARTLVWLEAY